MDPEEKEEREGEGEKRKGEIKGVRSEKPAYDHHCAFNKHLLNTYYMPGAVLRQGNRCEETREEPAVAFPPGPNFKAGTEQEECLGRGRAAPLLSPCFPASGSRYQPAGISLPPGLWSGAVTTPSLLLSFQEPQGPPPQRPRLAARFVDVQGLVPVPSPAALGLPFWELPPGGQRGRCPATPGRVAEKSGSARGLRRLLCLQRPAAEAWTPSVLHQGRRGSRRGLPAPRDTDAARRAACRRQKRGPRGLSPLPARHTHTHVPHPRASSN